MTKLHYDLCVIGGGINGTGIARDAAGRGLSVLLVEAEDLASGTSAASTKLIHGGLRYLENYEFAMVRSALKERDILLRVAPHLIRAADIVLPCDALVRPAWKLRAGLFVYDLLAVGRTKAKASRSIDLLADPLGRPLKSDLEKGFVYYDGWGDDTRLVIANAIDAAARKATILTRTTCVGLNISKGRWNVDLKHSISNEKIKISASMVVNATGPWVEQFLEATGISNGDPDLPKVKLVKGSHIIVPRQYDGDHLYLLQQMDNRVVFVIPYEQKYTLIGTTEENFNGNPRNAIISEAETNYLCQSFSASFENTITPKDVLFNYSGVRPLFDDGQKNSSKITRDYKIYHHKRYGAPLLSVFGGKLTTYRILAQDVVNTLSTVSGRLTSNWTADVPLAGGDFPHNDFSLFVEAQRMNYPWLSTDLLHRFARAYGTRMDIFLQDKQSYENLGPHYGNGVYEAEVDYLVKNEWAMSAEDILWRRSKLGLHVEDKTVNNIEDYFIKSFDHNKVESD